jgi:hypothetical protein
MDEQPVTLEQCNSNDAIYFHRRVCLVSCSNHAYLWCKAVEHAKCVRLRLKNPATALIADRQR